MLRRRSNTREKSRILAGKGGSIPRIRWGKFDPMLDYWGRVIPRFYRLETFARALEGMVANHDRFLIPSIQQVLGPAPVVALNIELFQEGAYQLIFRVRAFNQKRKEATFALVAAKQDGVVSRTAEMEHQNLTRLHRRAPDVVVKPYLGGIIFLPDRYGRPEKGRKLYLYLTQWLTGFHELGIDRSHQFFINTRTPHLFSKTETEELKAQMVEIIFRLYDPEARTSIEMPQIASGDFVVTPASRKPLKLKLIACRKILSGLEPETLIDQMAHTEWDWGGRPFRLAPEKPEHFVEAMIRAVGKDLTRAWLQRYRECLNADTYRASPYAEGICRASL